MPCGKDVQVNVSVRAFEHAVLGLADAAVRTLARAMNDESAPLSIRVRAADAVLGRLLQLRELVILEERVRELEKAMKLIRQVPG